MMSTTEERRITTSGAHESDLRSPDQIPRSPQAQGFNIINHTTPRATHGRPFQESPLSPSPSVYPSSSYLTPQGNSISANLNSSVSAASSRSFAASPGLVSLQASLSASLAAASPAAHSLRPDDISSSVSSSPQVIRNQSDINGDDDEMEGEEMEMEDVFVSIIPQPLPEKTIRVQFLTTKQSLRNVSGQCEHVKVVGSLPQLNEWNFGCNMEDRNGAWTYDMLLTGPYTEETVIEFLYKYTAHNNRGDQIWESRVSRCRLQLDKLLDHVFDRAHAAHAKTKVVFQANGIPPCDSSMDLIITGSLLALGNWDMKQARGLRKASAGGTHHTTVFVSVGTEFNYAYFLVRRMGVLFHGLPSFFSAESQTENNAAILWGSGVGMLKVIHDENACVQLLDEWEHATDIGAGGSFPPLPSAANMHSAGTLAQNTAWPHKVATTNPNSKPLTAATPEELMELQKNLSERLMCKVCWENDVSMVFVPCGHACVCVPCGQKMTKCALCRTTISQRIKTYI